MKYLIKAENVLTQYDLLLHHAPNTDLISATLEQEANRAGVFTFSLAKNHPCYDVITLFSTRITIDQDGTEIFSGRAVSEDMDIEGVKTYTCYDMLGLLDYSIQRPTTISGNATQVLTALLNNHVNETSQQFSVGTVSISAGTISIKTNYETTLSYINKLTEQYGGYVRVREPSSGYYVLDWLSGSPRTSTQQIKLGSNVLSLAKSIQTDDFGTDLIPIGNNGLTITSVNGGLDYLQSANASTYGNIWRTVTFNDINSASALKAAGQKYLAQIENPIMAIEISAIDLSHAFSDVDTIHLLDSVLVTSKLHGINANYDVTKIYTDICDPSNNRITLNKNMRLPISRSVANLQNK